MLKTVLLIMRRASLAQGLMAKVQDAPGLQLCYEPDYANADVAIRSHLATGALLEVAEDGAQDIDFCLALCAWLREVTPHCRLMLMCPRGADGDGPPGHRGQAEGGDRRFCVLRRVPGLSGRQFAVSVRFFKWTGIIGNGRYPRFRAYETDSESCPKNYPLRVGSRVQKGATM